MNKMAVANYWDPDTTESVKLAVAAYNIELKAMECTDDPNEVQICVYGPTENVDRFIADNEEGDLDPFDNTRDMSDNEYLSWLSIELGKIGVLYIPHYVDEEEPTKSAE